MRFVWLLTGILSVTLGLIGIVVPLLPTTPFILLAAFAFSKSSSRWHNWLTNHKVFGSIIKNWKRHGAINRHNKIAGTLSMVAIFCISLALNAQPVVLIVQAIVLMAAAAFVLSRPSPPPE